MRFILIIGLLTSDLSAQSVSVGVKGGVPFTPAFDAQDVNPSGQFGRCGECATERTLPYVIGPTLEMHLRGAFSMGLEALYSRADYNDTRSILFLNGGYIDSTDQKHLVDRWEIPILLKLAVRPWRQVRPFIAAGVSFQYNQDRTASGANFDINDPNGFKTHNNSTALGSTFGVGASFGSGRIRPSMEFRYTHWNDAAVLVTPTIPMGVSATTLRSEQNEMRLLASVMFGVAGEPNRSGSAGKVTGSERFLAVGVKGGLPLTEAFETHNTAAPGTCFGCARERTLPYVAGPALEVWLGGRFLLDLEGLYSRADYDFAFQMFTASSGLHLFQYKRAVSRWEFPLLLKYQTPNWHFVHPFVAAGVSVQYSRNYGAGYLAVSSDLFGHTESFTSSGDPSTRSVLLGPTAGVGASFGSWLVRPSLEARYTRWTDQAVRFGASVGVPPAVQSAQNQMQFLVGLMF